MDFAKALIEKGGVSSVPGSCFGKEVGEGHVRLSYATSIANIEKAVERIRITLPKIK
jgi:aspartate/methionine/tyrosine aminotransferase